MATGTLPYGLWPSPLAPGDLAGDRRLRDVAWDSDGRTLVWLEGRGPKGVLVCQRGVEAPRDLNAGLSVRARVGYGGGDFAVDRGRVYFVEASGRLYVQDLHSGPPVPLTPSFGQAAAPAPSPDGRHLVYVHSVEGVDRLATVDSSGSAWPQILAEGADFYMQPVWHPSGRHLAWIEWDQPQMPWDGTRLVLASVRRSSGAVALKEKEVIAGDEKTAVFQPAFSPNGRHLAYISDTRGWSNLWLYDLESGEHRCLNADAHDVARPAWVQGLRVCTFSADGKKLYFTRCEDARLPLYVLDLESGSIEAVKALADYACIEQPTAAPRGSGLACIAAASGIPPRIVAWNGQRSRICARSSDEAVAPETLARPQHLSWTVGNGTQVYGLYYPPTGRPAVETERPPLIIMVHGGPTSQSLAGYEARNQFFATRGWGVLDLNYRGSTGYGRRYMEALRLNWGVLDVEDALTGGRFLADAGLADPDRLVVMGGSAGGYTVLRALGQHPGAFRAGVCLYGVSDLFGLAGDTHKFEARYLDSLVGPLPETAAVYRERSPIFRPDAIVDPLAVFQGTEDEVVPQAQAEAIVESLRRRDVPHTYHLYEGEGHGWRRPETIEHFYGAVDSFLRRHVLFS